MTQTCCGRVRRVAMGVDGDEDGQRGEDDVPGEKGADTAGEQLLGEEGDAQPIGEEPWEKRGEGKQGAQGRQPEIDDGH